MISSVVLSSCHFPAKLFVQSSSICCLMDAESSDMSSNFTSLLRFASFDQYLALAGDGAINTLSFIILLSNKFRCKNKNKN